MSYKEVILVQKRIQRHRRTASQGRRKDKVEGKALYSGDLSLPGMLCGMILRSPFPHAKLIRINTEKALRLPGVKAIVTGEDTPKVKYGVISRSPKYMDEYPLAVDKVRFIGDEVAAVAAIDPDAALEALELIEVEYEALPGIFSIEEAKNQGRHGSTIMPQQISAANSTSKQATWKKVSRKVTLFEKIPLKPSHQSMPIWNPRPPLLAGTIMVSSFSTRRPRRLTMFNSIWPLPSA